MRTSVNHNHWVRICLGSWVVYGLVLGALVLLQPYSHSLTPFYAEAAFNFWSAHVEELNALHGFYYLPVARLLFTPFAFAGIAVGGLLWWMVGYGLITLSAWQWARLLVPGERSRAFAMILVVTLPASAAVLRNGQFDAPTWALMALGAAAVGGGQWWRAAAALGFALAIKPNAIVAIMLIGVIWLPVGLRLMPFIAVLLAIPYINPNWTYVNELYVSWIHQTVDALPQPGRWNNLANALAYFGIDIPYQTMTFVWLVAAVATLVFGLATARQLPRIHAAFVVLMLTAVYLLLFNPRTEGSSYVGLALVAAPIAARLAFIEGRSGWSAAVAALAILPGMVGVAPLTMRLFGIWLGPLLACIFLVAVITPRARPAAWAARDSARLAS